MSMCDAYPRDWRGNRVCGDVIDYSHYGLIEGQEKRGGKHITCDYLGTIMGGYQPVDPWPVMPETWPEALPSLSVSCNGPERGDQAHFRWRVSVAPPPTCYVKLWYEVETKTREGSRNIENDSTEIVSDVIVLEPEAYTENLCIRDLTKDPFSVNWDYWFWHSQQERDDAKVNRLVGEWNEIDLTTYTPHFGYNAPPLIGAESEFDDCVEAGALLYETGTFTLSVTVRVLKWSFVEGYEPDDPIIDRNAYLGWVGGPVYGTAISRPCPDRTPNGFPLSNPNSVVAGCMNFCDTNFNSWATCDDGSCSGVNDEERCPPYWW
jgi:hypothetical protein